jgi:gliding motility-associated-like protein
MTVGRSSCDLDQDFAGMLDEIRLFNRAISREEVEDLFFSPDEIANGLHSAGTNDTTIFLGNSVQVNLTNTCFTDFSWSPTAGINDPKIAEPMITPSSTTTYTLTFFNPAFPCVKTDSLRITVVDPATLDCKDILLPSAFTPNDDGLNDTYGISNPFVAGEILAFQIFDRWGNILFETIDPLERWDGSYRGEPVNPGVFLYKIHFRCRGEEGLVSGSVTVIR